MRALLMLFALVACCGDDAQLTWGDAVTEVGTEACAAAEQCGFRVQPSCVESALEQWCRACGTCDVELPDGAEVSVEACAEAYQSRQPGLCARLELGLGLDECQSFFALNPWRPAP